jgi:indolepyruvate ferredoxin oxidoreductase alpha subunit
MNGLEAALRAAEDAAVSVRTYVPGYPITDLAQALRCQISVNEKVALEIALGASATGLRSLVVVKQVGMNLLADPLVISATHGIGSGVVVLVGDDLGPRRSQAEMDSRFYAPLSELPLLDPSRPGLLHASLLEAYILSEKLRVPVIVRVTSRLLAAQEEDIPSRPLPITGQRFEKENRELTAKGRHQRHHDRIMAFAQEASESSPLNQVQISGDVGIIASGYPARLAQGLGVSVLALAYSYPLPGRLLSRFIDGHRLILVAEEPEPFLESILSENPKIRGKLTGHLPRGALERSDIIQSLEGLEGRPDKMPQAYESVAERGYEGVCPDCPFRALFSALANVDAPVAGDAGCSIRATREPFSSADVAYGLGSAAAVASGLSGKGIALMGDFALAHSGLAGLINAVWQKRDLLAVVLKNDVAAMTGFQEAPDLSGILEALLPTRYLDLPAPEEEVETVLQEELARQGPSVLVARGRCVMKKDSGKN